MKDTVHTNGIENFWSLLKRTIKGTYVSVEPFHLFRYLDEQGFRFNEREGMDRTRFTSVVGSVAGRRLTYKCLSLEKMVSYQPTPPLAKTARARETKKRRGRGVIALNVVGW